MYELAKVAGYLLSPLTMVMLLWLASAVCVATGRRRVGLTLAAIAFVGLYVASTPATAVALRAGLEVDYPALTTQDTPAADAIVILGGAVAGRHPPRRPFLGLHAASGRIWHAAELYRAGKARWIVIAAGGDPADDGEQVEADAIAEMLTTLGVPASALRLERLSRNTRQNANNVKPILDELKARKILLVTSAHHMHRALATFRKAWADSAVTFVPVSTDQADTEPNNSLSVWIPSPNALLDVTKAMREYTGKIGLVIM